MAVETVEIYCYDEQVVPALVDGVLVRVYNEAGDTFITQGYTGDADTGKVEFSLDGAAAPSPINYTIRLSKQGVAFDGYLGDKSKSPQLIAIYSPASGSPTGTNNFEVYGNLFHNPVSSDPYLCRVSGYIMNQDGTAFAKANVFVENLFDPIIVNGRAVLGRRQNYEADDDGFVSFNLYRQSTYRLAIEGLIDTPREVHVPDLDGFSLTDLLFPIVAQVVYAPTSVSVAVGEETEVTPTVTFSDGRTGTGAAGDDVTYTAADEGVASVGIRDDKLVIIGVAAGSTTVSASRSDTSIIILPTPTITQTPLQITVT